MSFLERSKGLALDFENTEPLKCYFPNFIFLFIFLQDKKLTDLS